MKIGFRAIENINLSANNIRIKFGKNEAKYGFLA